jgi:hypothetical protein
MLQITAAMADLARDRRPRAAKGYPRWCPQRSIPIR